MYLIDDADWSHSIRILKQEKLTKSEKLFLDEHILGFEDYLAARKKKKNKGKITIGMTVDKKYYNKYIKTMRKYEAGREYLKFADAVMSADALMSVGES